MASEVKICNLALQMVKVGKRISSLTENTKESNACEEAYEELRDELLEMHTWNQASKRLKLNRLTSTPPFGYDYEYALPGDFIRVHGVWDNPEMKGRVDYKLEDGKLLSDANAIYLKFVYRLTDVNQMAPTFRLALSKLLASRLAVALAQSTSLAKELYDQFRKTDLPKAKSVDAVQDTADQPPESEWVIVRGGSRPLTSGDPATS